MVSWQLLSPPYVGNDEPWHAARAYSIWHGAPLFGTTLQDRTNEWVGGPMEIPSWVLGRSSENVNETDWRCFIHQITSPATCATYSWEDDSKIVEIHPVADYPPAGYLWLGLPTLFSSGEAAYTLMRLFGFVATAWLMIYPIVRYRKSLPKVFVAIIPLFIIPSVSFHLTGISVDGMLFAAVFAFATVLVVLTKFYSPRRKDLVLLAFLGSIICLLKITGLVAVLLAVMYLLMVKSRLFKPLIFGIAPAAVFSVIHAAAYPFAYPNNFLGLADGSNVIQRFTGSAVGFLMESWRTFFMGDYQVNRQPQATTIFFIIWFIVAIYAISKASAKSDSVAVAFLASTWIAFCVILTFIEAPEWFLPLQSRYSWPFLFLVLILLLGSASSNRLIQLRLPLKTGYFSWLTISVAGFLSAAARFSQGIKLPEGSVWYSDLVGLWGKQELLFIERDIPSLATFSLALVIVGYGLIQLGLESRKRP